MPVADPKWNRVVPLFAQMIGYDAHDPLDARPSAQRNSPRPAA
jgi:hypothetical protein